MSYIMDVFGNLSRPKPKRRKRCVVCNELTWSSLWKTYHLPKSDRYVDGIHCQACAEMMNKLWNRELEQVEREEQLRSKEN